MTNEQFEQLKKPFRPNEVQWRVSVTSKNSTPAKGLAVPYLDSRAIQNRLDEVIGRENWQNEYSTHALGKDNAFICTISVYYTERNEWISKSNGAGSTNIEPVKGGLSDAFKRAASMWNIGRYLYEFNGVWVELDEWKNIAKKELPKLEKVYTDTVNRLFPQPAKNANSRGSQQGQSTPPSNHPPLPSQSGNAPAIPIKEVPRLAQTPVYTVVSAKYIKNSNHTVLVLRDNQNRAFTVYYQGEAQLAQNQDITDVITQEKNSETAGKYFVMVTYRIADSSNYPHENAA